MNALKANLVFKGIPEALLEKVVGRMFMMSFPADSEILQQGALPKDNDCMYYLHQGTAEVVISGAYDRTAKQVRWGAGALGMVRCWTGAGVCTDASAAFGAPQTLSPVIACNMCRMMFAFVPDLSHSLHASTPHMPCALSETEPAASLDALPSVFSSHPTGGRRAEDHPGPHGAHPAAARLGVR